MVSPSAFFCLSAAQQTANLSRKDPFTPSCNFLIARHAAVDGQVHAVEEGRLVAGQIQHRIGPHPPRRSGGQRDLVEPGLLLHRVRHQSRHKGRVHGGGMDGVAADVVLAIPGGHRLGVSRVIAPLVAV